MTTYISNSSLSPSSEKKHNSFLNKWVELTPTKSVLYIILFPAHSLLLLTQYLKQRDIDIPYNKSKAYSSTNMHSYLSAVLALFKHATQYVNDIPQSFVYYRIWIGIVNDNQKGIIERRNNNKPTKLQELRGGSKLTLQDIVNKRDENNLDIMHKLLLAMYTMIPPVRCDYYSMNIVNKNQTPNTDNYIILKDGEAELVIKEYKTSRKHGDIVHSKLPDELYRIIINSLETVPRDYLFVNSRNKPFSRTDFSNWASKTLYKIFGVELTLTMIRHIYISHKELHKMTLGERKELGEKMGHTVEIQTGYEWKE